MVASADGTQVSVSSVGTGPGVVIWHGSMEHALSHVQLAALLADEFTVHLVDRRGHGLTGSAGPAYGMQREVEDAQAVLRETGSSRMFGISAGGLVVLETARLSPDLVTRAAVYEPALLMGSPQRTAWLARFDREMATGDVAAAMVTSMKGLQLAPAAVNLMPRWLLEAFTKNALKSEDRSAKASHVTMRQLAPTLHNEGVLIKEMDGRLNSFADVGAEILLMGGSKGLSYLRPAMSALETVLPVSSRVEYDGLDHGGASDPSQLNSNGSPAVVAPDLRRWFATGRAERDGGMLT
jgi:pimeloyl-ACP methyl ester carboxylesterase